MRSSRYICALWIRPLATENRPTERPFFDRTTARTSGPSASTCSTEISCGSRYGRREAAIARIPEDSRLDPSRSRASVVKQIQGVDELTPGEEFVEAPDDLFRRKRRGYFACTHRPNHPIRWSETFGSYFPYLYGDYGAWDTAWSIAISAMSAA